jgi:hypothetical protein
VYVALWVRRYFFDADGRARQRVLARASEG